MRISLIMQRLQGLTRQPLPLGLVRLAMLALALAMLPFAAAPAFAHAALVATEPADGAVLPKPPAAFVMTFSEAVSPLVLRLIGPDGKAQSLAGAELKGKILSIPAPKTMAAGTSALSWRVISEDGHPVGGTLVFSVGAPSAGGAPDAAAVVDKPVRSLVWFSKLLLYLGLFVGVGGTTYGVLVQPLGGSRLAAVRLALAIGLIAAPLTLGAQGLDALGTTVDQLGQALVWQTAWATSFGRTVALALAAVVLGLAATVLRPRPLANGAALLALTGLGLALAASGHASSAAPSWLMRPAVFVHAVTIALWVGSLIPLGLALCRRGPEPLAALARFSAVIPFVVAPLILSGAVLAVVQLGSLGALDGTAYGRVLLVKLALVAALLTLAAVNRWRLTAGVAAPGASTLTALVRSIAVEAVLVLLILGTDALWRFTPPPRALAAAAAEPVSVHAMSNRVMADISVTPGHVGSVTARAVLMTTDYGGLDAKGVTFVFTHEAAGLEPIRREAAKPGDGSWQADVVLPVPGRWTVRADVLIDHFTLDRVEGAIDLRP